MEDRPVPYRHVAADEHRVADAGMDHAVVLDVGTVPDHDPVLVCTDHRPEPDPHLTADRDIAGDRCIAGCKQRLAGELPIHTHNNIGN